MVIVSVCMAIATRWVVDNPSKVCIDQIKPTHLGGLGDHDQSGEYFTLCRLH